MNSRVRTFVSFFSVAAAATLVGALAQSRAVAPRPLFAGAPEPAPPPVSQAAARAQGGVTLDTFRDIARDKTAGVVNISTRKTVPVRRFQSPFDFFGEDFFGRRRDRDQGQERPRSESQSQYSLGSGFVIDRDGYILTNRHVIDEVDDITVRLVNGHTYDAKLVGKDARTDVALIKIEPHEPLTTIEMGDSEQAEVGEWVMAIGQPFGLGNTVTVGVVSFKGRTMSLGDARTGVEMLQTDAAINPGNSGGPLLNARGQVIGINTMIATAGLSQNAGVGFAVPINVARQILPQLREKGRVVRGWMGVTIRSLDENLAKTYGLKDASGALVTEVTSGSPAEKAGIKPEDVIVEADGRPVKDNTDLTGYVAGQAPGTTIRLKVLRDRAENVKPFSVTLGTFPESDEAPQVAREDTTSLGMTLRELTPSLVDQHELPRGMRGLFVVDVAAGSAAERAGLTPGDVILSVNSATVASVAEFESAIGSAKASGLARLRTYGRRGYQVLSLKLS